MNLKLAPSDYEVYIPLAEWIEGNIKEWLFEQRPLFKKISAPIDTVLNSTLVIQSDQKTDTLYRAPFE